MPRLTPAGDRPVPGPLALSALPSFARPSPSWPQRVPLSWPPFVSRVPCDRIYSWSYGAYYPFPWPLRQKHGRSIESSGIIRATASDGREPRRHPTCHLALRFRHTPSNRSERLTGLQTGLTRQLGSVLILVSSKRREVRSKDSPKGNPEAKSMEDAIDTALFRQFRPRYFGAPALVQAGLSCRVRGNRWQSDDRVPT